MHSSTKAAIATAALFASSALAIAADTTPGNFPAQQPNNLWRASKLPGVAIYGPDNKKVGSVSDVLVDHDGKATHIVIGVGGFLGMGEKDVALPYDQVKFTDQPITPPAAEQPPAGAAPAGTTPPAASPGASGGAAGTGMGAGSGGGAPAAPAPEAAKPISYPDHGTITLTADQLKAANGFQYAK